MREEELCQMAFVGAPGETRMFFPSERAGNPSLLWSYLMPDPSGSGGGRGHQKALWCFSPIGELILSNLRRNAAS